MTIVTLPWFVIFSVLLFVASAEDIKEQKLTYKTTFALMGLSALSLGFRLEWHALAGYIFLNIVSTFFYENDYVQYLGAGALVMMGLFTPFEIGFESMAIIFMMAVLWVFFFITKRFIGERGGADFNVIYTTLCVFGTTGYFFFAGTAVILGVALALYEIVLHSKEKKLNNILFQVYLRFTDKYQRHLPVALDINGKSETIPFIPVLYVFVLVSITVWGLWLGTYWWTISAFLMILMPSIWFVKSKGWKRRDFRLINNDSSEDSSDIAYSEE